MFISIKKPGSHFKITTFVLLIMFVFPVFAGFYAPSSVSAQDQTGDNIDSQGNRVTGEFIDQHIIRVMRGSNEILFRDNNPYDDQHEYEGGPASCRHSFGLDWSDGSVTLKFKGIDSTGECADDSEFNVFFTLTNQDRKVINAYRISADEIFTPITLDGNSPGCDDLGFSWTINGFINQKTDGSWKRRPANEREAQNQYLRDDTDSLYENMYIETSPGGDNYDLGKFRLRFDHCGPRGWDWESSPSDIIWITERELPRIYDEDGDGNPDGEGGTGQGEQPDVTCETELLNPLTWIACPLIAAAREATEIFDNAITTRLTIETNRFFNTGPGKQEANGFYLAWSTFRYLALILLVIIGLVMVISQATSASFVDAYTVKRVIPRIFIAVILITLSWSLMKFAVDITNALGVGLRSVIYAPFSGLESAGADGGAAALLTIAAGGAILGLGFLGLLSLALTAAMAVIIGFGIIVFREMLIMLLVVTAPIAIIAWILPGTNKVWNMWSDFFLKALLAFPIITMMIATGHVFSKIALAGNEQNTLSVLIAFIAYFGPYFMIPAAFRMAGGALATISGIANDKSRGAFDRLSSFRKNRSAERVKNFRSGGHYNENTRRGRIGNKLGGWAFNADEKIPYALGKRGVPGFTGAYARLGAQVHHAQEEQTKELAQIVQGVGGNSKTGAAMSGALSHLSEDTQRRLETDERTKHLVKRDDRGRLVYSGKGLQSDKEYSAVADIMRQSDDVADRNGGKALESVKGHALNLNRQGKGFTNVAAAGGLIVASHGFMKEDDLIDVGRHMEGSGSDSHFSEAMLTSMEVAGAKSGLKATYSHSRDEKGKLISGTEAGRDWDLALSKSYAELAGQKKHAVDKDARALEEIIVAGDAITKAPPEKQAEVQEQMIQKYMEAHPKVKREVAESKFKDIQYKAEAAKATLAQTLNFTPGATDTSVIISQVKDRLKNEHGIELPLSSGRIDPESSRGGPSDGPPVDPFAGTPPTPSPPSF